MKNLFVLSLLFLLMACGKESVEPFSLSPNLSEKGVLTPYLTDKIDYAKAVKIAQQAPTRFEGEFTKGFTKTVVQGEPIISQGIITKSGTASVDTLLYVFNYAEGGYAVVPTLEVESDLIAYIEEGTFNIQDTLTDDLSRFLVSMMMDYQKMMVAQYEKEQTTTKGELRPDPKKGPIGPKCLDVVLASGMNYNFGEPTAEAEIQSRGDEYYKKYGCYLPMRYTDHEAKYLGPLLTTAWGQGKPYNWQSKKIGTDYSKTGCVALAMAQIMVYHAHPAKYPSTILNFGITSAFRTYVGKNTNLEAMKKIKDLNTQGSSAAKDNVSRFIAIIGYMLNNDWGVDETAAYDEDVPKVFNNIGYATPPPRDYNSADIVSNLGSGMPVYTSGIRDGNKGHAWVVDGYKREYYTEAYYYYFFGANGAYHGRRRQDAIVRNYNDLFLHCNYGWSGSANGYYYEGVFNTSNVHERTGTDGNAGRYYKYDLTIVPNIKPI